MPDGSADVALSNALQSYVDALRDFELAVTSGQQPIIRTASEKVARTLEQLARTKEQFEQGEAQILPPVHANKPGT